MTIKYISNTPVLLAPLGYFDQPPPHYTALTDLLLSRAEEYLGKPDTEQVREAAEVALTQTLRQAFDADGIWLDALGLGLSAALTEDHQIEVCYRTEWGAEGVVQRLIEDPDGTWSANLHALKGLQGLPGVGPSQTHAIVAAVMGTRS